MPAYKPEKPRNHEPGYLLAVKVIASWGEIKQRWVAHTLIAMYASRQGRKATAPVAYIHDDVCATRGFANCASIAVRFPSMCMPAFKPEKPRNHEPGYLLAVKVIASWGEIKQ